jgi:glycosyltransferase involved in cell wall biosynthesis
LLANVTVHHHSQFKVLHVIHSLDLRNGGPPEGLRQLVKGWEAEGVRVEVATLDDPNAPFLQGLPFQVHALGPGNGTFGYTPRLRSWLNENLQKYDAVVINGIWQYHCLLTGRLARNKVPYAVFVHGALDPWFKERYPLKHLKKLLYWRPFQYPVLRDAMAVLFTSKIEKEQALLSFRLNQWNGIVVPYGCNPPSGDPVLQTEAFHAFSPAVRDRRFLLFMGRIHEKKGCDLLIDAFSRIASEASDLDLVIAGPDQVGWKNTLEKQAEGLGIRNRIHWPGHLQGDAKWGAFRACEAFILPSHQENFGIAVAEAMACGRAVLISDKVNIWQDIANDQAGLVESDTAEGVCRMLRAWLQLSEPEKAAMSARASACFAKRYSMRETARALRSMFEKELQTRKGYGMSAHSIPVPSNQ